jgi:hypothetical protein
MGDLLLPYFKLQESEAQIIADHKTPWWQFWKKNE